MLKIHEIREIIKLIDQTSISEFKIEDEGTKLCIKKGTAGTVYTASPAPELPAAPAVQAQAPATVPAPAPQAAPAPVPQAAPAPALSADVDETNLHKITSPMVGTFYGAPEPGAAPYVSGGDKVKNNTIVCIVEAMKLFNEIEAEVSGEIVKVLVQDGQLVEYGQPLFLVKAD